MRTHNLELKKQSYIDIFHGPKRFLLRPSHYKFKVGDTITLSELDDDKRTGRTGRVKVTYILNGPAYGLDSRACILSFRMLPRLG